MAANDGEATPIKAWQSIYARLADEVDPVVFHPWLEPLKFVEVRDDVAYLAHASGFRRDWVVNTYEEYLLELWRGAMGNIRAVEILVQPDDSPLSAPERAVVVEHPVVASDRSARSEPSFEPTRQQVGRVGVWSRSPYFYGPDQATDLARTAEELGFSALWIPGFDGGHIFERCALALEASSDLMVATGILNIWRHEPADVVQAVSRLREDSGGRFLLGIGGSHRFLIGRAYDQISPVAKMNNYLDALDAEGQPAAHRLLGALGPRMLALSGHRSLGAHPCFIPPEFTADARETLGEEPLLMPQLTVILDSNPSSARAYARKFAGLYFKGPNYANMLRRFGFTDDDFQGEGSDRLIDACIAWGTPEAIAARVRAHLDAGADHVAIESRGTMPEAEVWRELAPRILS